MLNNYNFIDRIRLPFRKEKELYSSLYKILGFYPRNIQLYKQALLHKSLRRRNEKGRPLNNERLEFLGDAILDAVEGEVYAYSSAFTAVVFWLILKWEDHADEPHSDRWLVLIAYMTGLSIGVHLLNLLCIPAIVLVYYYKRFPNADLKGSLIALAVSFVIIAGG